MGKRLHRSAEDATRAGPPLLPPNHLQAVWVWLEDGRLFRLIARSVAVIAELLIFNVKLFNFVLKPLHMGSKLVNLTSSVIGSIKVPIRVVDPFYAGFCAM
jgi:hypothetical protein